MDFDFHAEIIEDLATSPEGGILLLSKGLGFSRILALFILQQKSLEKSALFLFLNFDEDEIQAINDFILKLSPKNLEKTGILSISSEPIAKRTKYYLSGGFYAVTPVILLFDLYQNGLSPLILKGVVIKNLEDIRTNLAKEFWIATLIRLETQKTYILGILEDLEAFYSAGNNNDLQGLLRNLLLNKVFLWPTCRFEVQRSLIHNGENAKRSNEIEENIKNYIKNEESKESKEEIKDNKEEITQQKEEIIQITEETTLNKGDKIQQNEETTVKNEESTVKNEEITENSQFLNENKDKISEIISQKSFPMRTFEAYIKLTPLQRKIQDSLLLIMETLRLEINRNSSKSPSFLPERHSISFEDISSLTYRAFYRKLLRIKDLKLKTLEERLKDLSSFKFLLQDLVNCDACGFLRKLENISESADNQSIWCLGDQKTQEELGRLRTYSKKRVFELQDTMGFEFRLSQVEFQAVLESKQQSQQQNDETNNDILLNESREIAEGGSLIKEGIIGKETKDNAEKSKFVEFQLKKQIKLNLEVSPKLEVLRKTLEKIREKITLSPERKGVIWIHAGSEDKARMISDYLSSTFYRGDKQVLNAAKALLFFLNTPQAKNSRISRILELIKRRPIEFTDVHCQDLLLEEKRQIFSQFLDSIRELEVLATSIEEQPLKLYRELFQDFAEKQGLGKGLDFSEVLMDRLNEIGQREFPSQSILPGCDVLVNSLAKNQGLREGFLNKFKPKFVILFEPNMAIIRESLVYQKYQGTAEMSLHILMFQNTVESAEYVEAAKRENRLFEKLVWESKSLVEIKETARDRIKKLEYPGSFNPRVGGVQTNINRKAVIIVDKRELYHGTTLPAKLFYEGFTVIPRFLDKGDYILSDDMAIERKSVISGDLVESLKNGRLDKQAKTMIGSFKKTGLLIEFSDDWKFSFESLSKMSIFQDKGKSLVNDNSEEETRGISRSSICLMLSVLVMKYPNFNIFWSKGDDNTAKLFTLLKKNLKEPDPNKYLPKGEDKEEELLLGDLGKSRPKEDIL